MSFGRRQKQDVCEVVLEGKSCPLWHHKEAYVCVLAHIFWKEEVNNVLLLFLEVLFFWGVPWEAGNRLSETKSELCTLWIFHILINGSKLSFRKASQRRHVHHRADSASDKTQDSLKLNRFRLFFFDVSVGFFSVELWRNVKRSKWRFFFLLLLSFNRLRGYAIFQRLRSTQKQSSFFTEGIRGLSVTCTLSCLLKQSVL